MRGYRNWFGVDWACAFRELEMLGVEIDPKYKRQVLRDVRDTLAARRRRKEMRESAQPLFEWDANFAYIAGYTPAGFPFGVRWEDWVGPHPRDEDDDPSRTDDDFPF